MSRSLSSASFVMLSVTVVSPAAAITFSREFCACCSVYLILRCAVSTWLVDMFDTY